MSLLLHVLLILLYPLLVGTGPDDARRPAPTPEASRPEGTEIVRIVEVPADELERPDTPELERVPVAPPTPRPAAPGRAAPDAGDDPEAAEGLNAAERVRASGPDVRLVAPLSRDVVAPSSELVAQLELTWAIEDANRAAALAAEAERRARDWTRTDADGKRWGLSPEGLHLGGITIPLGTFGAPYDPNAWKGSMDADLERAAVGAAAHETREERARKIRERKDREREQKADTTRRGGGG